MKQKIVLLVFTVFSFSMFAQPLSGTYSIGWGGGDTYQTLFQAITDLETNGASGAVVFELSADYNPTPDAYPIFIEDFAGSSDVNTLTIRPANGTQHYIERDVAVAVLCIRADNVIIDGSNNGTSSRDLTFSTIHTSDSISAIAVYHVDNAVVKNCILTVNTKEHVSAGIACAGSSNVTFENNKVYNSRTGIAVDTCDNVNILNNELGSDIASQYLNFGVQLRVSSNINVDGNNIFKLIDDDVYESDLAICGIACEQLEGDISLTNNTIDSLIHTGNNNVVHGIALNMCNTSSFTIANNHISNLASDAYTDNIPGAIAVNSPQLSSISIIHNSINMPENNLYGVGGTGDNSLVGGLIVNSGSGITFKNNIISNKLGTRDGATSYTLGAAIALSNTDNPFVEINNNVYFVSDDYSLSSMALYPGGPMNLVQWQAFTGGDQSSVSQEDICFVSDNDLHLNSCSPAIARAEFLEVFSADIQGVDRDTNYASIGAYEYEIIQASNVFLSAPVKGWGYGDFVSGTGNKKIVFIKEGDFLPETPLPENATTYYADEYFGDGDQIGASGWYCVYNGIENCFYVIDGNSFTEYTVMVCEYFGSEGNEIYVTDTAYLNPNIGCTGAEISEKTSQFSFYPNPASSFINIDVDEEILQFVIYDYTGKTVLFQSNLIDNQVDVGNLKLGVYLIEVTTNTAIFSEKLLILK